MTKHLRFPREKTRISSHLALPLIYNFSKKFKRNHPKTPKEVERWKTFKTDAVQFVFPSVALSNDITLPSTRGIEFNSEKDVDKVIGNHLDNFNRIFEDLGLLIRFRTKATAFSVISTDGTASSPSHPVSNFIGIPDNVLCSGSTVKSFIEDKTPNDLPVRHPNGPLFDLLTMYKEDLRHLTGKFVVGDIGRSDVINVVEQVYGYMALNNLVYGCVTCYDVSYFLWRPKRGTLLISDPI